MNYSFQNVFQRALYQEISLDWVQQFAGLLEALERSLGKSEKL